MKTKKIIAALRKTITLTVAFIFILSNCFPLGHGRVYAFDQDKFKVDSVTVFKVFDTNRNIEQRRILLVGSHLKDANVGIVTSTGYHPLILRTVNSDGLLQFELSSEQLGNSILIEGITIPINEGEMPTLTGISRRVSVGIDDLVLEGTNLRKVGWVSGSSKITAAYESGGANVLMPEEAFDNDYEVTINKPSGSLGLQNIIFKKNETIPVAFYSGINAVEVNVQYTYKDQFRLVQGINTDGIEMYPNRGEKGDVIFFEVANPARLDSYDVFFLKDLKGTSSYTNANKGKNKTFKQNVDGMDILTVEVPDLLVGEYNVVLTNAVTEGKDPMREIVQEGVIEEKFTVIDGNVKSKIISIQPDKGPDTGASATISGKFLVTMNIAEFTPADPDYLRITDEGGQLGDLPKVLKITYSPGTYKNANIKSAVRTIRVYTGGDARFLKNKAGEYDVIHSKDLDKLVILTPQVNDAEVNPKKDVVIEIETILTKDDNTSVVITERAALTDGYTYIPGTTTPLIDKATPDRIQVVRDTQPGTYIVPEDILIAIHGKNFMVHRLTTPDGREIKRYPIVEFGSEIGLNRNSRQNPGDPPSNERTDIRVFDSAGNELDGSEGSEIGTRILVTIPKGSKISNLGKTFIRVTNPVRNSENTGLSGLKIDSIEFVSPDESKNPVITAVTPSIVAVDGKEQITVEGSNFTTGVRVFIDGEEITGVNREGDGKKLAFICPGGREGETQLLVMNPEGGTAIWPFTYVKTYTNPKIFDFSPKKGNTGTLVIVNGDNFLKPDPTAAQDQILRLIGTRMLLEGIEVNEYNRNPKTKIIELRDYKSPSENPVLAISDGPGGKNIKPGDYYNAIIFEDMDSGRFFTLNVNSDGAIILSNGAGINYTIGISTDGNSIRASREGVGNSVLTIEDVDDQGENTSYSVLKIDDTDGSALRLKLRTLYKVEDVDGEEIITGNRVRVIDKNMIYFTVPILEADGYYDVTVINPDTKKDGMTDQRGFYYYGHPRSKPVITRIYPNQGSVNGGYEITISGQDFEDNGSTKSKVYVNGIEVKAEDTHVSVGGDSITIKVPKYPGDLFKDKGIGRLTVPIVVVNPDGGSAGKEDGFTYIVPGSYPQITRLVPQRGKASGGDVVEIIGTDFRYYEPYDDANRNQMRDWDEKFNDLNQNGTWDSQEEILDDRNEQLRGKTILEGHEQYSWYYASPILPKVYFGKVQAKIVEFSLGYIKVIVPPGTDGNTEVYIVNNDSGMSNKVTFTYVSSKPRIEKILPAQGRKQGKDKVEILGTDFLKSSIEIYTQEKDQDQNNIVEKRDMPMVRFDSISNRWIPREQENSGRIDNGKATVNLAGALRVEYDGINDRLVLTVTDMVTYQTVINGYNDSVKYIPLSLLRDSEGNTYPAYELIRVEVADRRLFVDRGYSPDVEYVNSSQLVVHTPSYYTVGRVTIIVTNPDGGQATGEFEYKNPSSSPRIINITKENQSPQQERINNKDVKVLRMNYKGGNIVSIIGEDFRENATIQISNAAVITSDKITYSFPDRLTFQMPQVSQDMVGKLCRVVVINEDGGTAASDGLSTPIYIIFTKGETTPYVDSITPNIGPANGGNRVRIEGRDFRERMDGYNGRISVYFGEIKVPDNDVTVVDYKTMYVIVPSNVPGKVELRIENPDGELSNAGIIYTYMSIPKIAAVVDPKDSGENMRISTISVEGGQEIKLKGSGFMEGARVVFNPVITKLDNVSQTGGTVIYIAGQPYALQGGNYGSSPRLIDSGTMTVITPQGKLGTSGVIVINPDGGASDIYQDLKYGFPEMASPSGVMAQLAFDRYIRITWNPVAGAREYEVFAVIDGDEAQLIGSTQFNYFVYSHIEPYTRYRFFIKAVGDLSISKPSAMSSTIRTGKTAGPPDTDGGLNENTIVKKSGYIAEVFIGEKDFDSKSITIDLTRGQLEGCREVVISMPASVVTSRYAKDITIIGRDFVITFNPKSFDTSKMREHSKEADAGVRFRVALFEGNVEVKSQKPGETNLSSQYNLEARVFTGKDNTVMDYLSSDIKMTLDFDTTKAKTRRLDIISLDRYDGYEGGWKAIKTTQDGMPSITTTINRLGIYSIMGRRR